MKPDHILIVEDVKNVASVLSEYLIEGFKTSCFADGGNDVLPFVKQKSPSLDPFITSLPFSLKNFVKIPLK